MRMAIPLTLVIAVACTNERAESLRAEVEKLKKERVDKTLVEKAKQEAADAEGLLASSRKALEQARSDFEKQQAELEQARAALAAEVSRNAQLQTEIAEATRRAQEQATEGQDLDAKIARAKAGARWVRDQAAVLAREIRPEDPSWATARRLQSLAEFLERVRTAYPDDPVVAEVARGLGSALDATPDHARAAAEQASRVRDRFTTVYELPPPSVAAAKEEKGP
jgi:hypothetical protein